MILRGHAVIIREDNIDTDVLYPGPYLNIDDPQQMKRYLFEGLDPALRDLLGTDTILVVGANFGVGSSREHVPLAMKASGIRAVIGVSFARIFRRNCINLGLPAITCPTVLDAVSSGDEIHVDLERGDVHVGPTRHESVPLPPFILDMIRSGGLVDWVRRRLE